MHFFLFRALAPILGGSSFAWSITSGAKIGFPFDVNLVFIMFGLVYLINNFISVAIPKSLQNQKK